MNQYSSLRKQNTGSASAVISLALCVVLSAAMLFSRLVTFATADTRHYIPLKYTLAMEACFSHQETPIPIHARVVDYQNNYLAGSAEETADVLELNNVEAKGTLAAGYIAPYTLEWEWPFELDDAYDTMLGNRAAEEDITLTIVIKTTASYTPEPAGGIPQTGDDSHIVLLTCIMFSSGTGLLFLLIPRRKRKDEEA